MEKKLEFGMTGLMVLGLGAVLLLRPAFGTWQLDTAATLAELLEQAEERASENDDSAETAAPATPTTTSASQTPQTATGDVQLAGLDVSHYQGTIDWKDVAEAGIMFAFAKTTDGITYTDPMWTTNKTNAPANGVLIGGYHFYQPADDPTQQADSFVAALGDISGHLPPVVDLEKAPDASSAAQYAGEVRVFLEAVAEATGCTPMIYASPSFYGEYLAAELAAFTLWLAEYRSTPPPADGPDWLFWQHSQNDFVNGISGAVDADWFAGDQQALTGLTC